MSCYKLNPDSSTCRLHPLSLAISLALAAVAQPLYAAPAAAHWTVTDLGSLGGTVSAGTSINNAGQVTGYAYTTGNATQHAFLYSNGSMVDLGTLGGSVSQGTGINASGQVTGFAQIGGGGGYAAFLQNNTGYLNYLGTPGGSYSFGYAINDAGQITGYGETASGGQRAFLYSNGSMTVLGTLGGSFSFGYGINAAGQVTGSATTAGGTNHAFLYTNGVMSDLGTLGGTYSYGKAINSSGLVAGYANTTGNAAEHAFLYSYGSMNDLGTLGGVSSYANSINSAGQVTGYSFTTGSAQHGFLYSNGSMTDLNSLNGVAGSGWTLAMGSGINDLGQITGYGANANAGGQSHAYILALDTTVWEYGYGAGWDYSGGWSQGIGPNKNTHAIIDPTRSLTVSGPSTNVDVKRLTVGGDSTGNNGIATLTLNGGTINVLGSGGIYTTVTAKGVLTGDGVLNGAVNNLGTVTAQNLTLSGGLNNQGLVNGSGRLNTSLTNVGTVQVQSGQTLTLNGGVHSNSGLFDLSGGARMEVTGSLTNNTGGQIYVSSSTARFNSAVTNASGGRIQIDDGVLHFNGGLSNNGQIVTTFGDSSVFGAVTTNAGGKVILSGNSNTTFYDAVDIKSGGEMRVSTGSNAVFFGLVNQRTGSLFTGTGNKFYEGGLSVGASPGLGSDTGNVSFGGGNEYLAEIGGTTAGTSFDFYDVKGVLSFGGTLKLVSWNSFVAQAGQRFDLFDGGVLQGTFDNIDSSGFVLAAGSRLDVSQLYVDGSISVQAVPEPESYAMLLAGLGLIGLAARRRFA
jgi:probable HAF family extracellular repeat protein